MSYSDEPILVAPARRWPLKTVGGIALVLLFVGGILLIPLYQNHLDEAAHRVRRGEHQGALYDISIGGAPHTLELGWTAPAFSAVLSPAPAAGTTLEVEGDFIHETLAWNPAKKCFGPGTTRMDPYAHHKVKLVLHQGDRVLWRDTLWCYGIHDAEGHTH